MTRILALDCAAEACSVALLDQEAISSRLERRARNHGPVLIAMVDELLLAAGLQATDLDALAFGCGPGSFTGLRIAAGITQGIAVAAGLPVLPVSDLAMLAQGAMDEEGAAAVAVCQDARMGQVFAGFYARDAQGLAVPLAEDALLDPAEVSLPGGISSWLAVGDGWDLPGLLQRLAGQEDIVAGKARLPEAKFALRLAQRDWKQGLALDAGDARPVYLRGRTAWRSAGP